MTLRRVLVASTGHPLAPETWSGSGLGLATGLRAWGVEVVGVDATPPRGVREGALALSAASTRSRVDAWYTGPMHRLRTRVVAQRLRRVGAIDAAILLGAEFDLPIGVPYAVWSDLTLAQARRYHPVFARISPSVADAWTARQERVYRGARAVCPGSTWTAASLVEDHGVDPSSVHVVGFGRNRSPSPHRGAWSPPRFLFVGLDWERKGGPALLRAFARLRDEVPEAELHLVGGHPDDVGAHPGVTGHGVLRALSDPADGARLDALFTSSTCFALPADCEPFGIVHAEAAAAGLPSIATTVGGPGTILGPHGGVLVAPGDEEALLAALRRLSDPDEAARMGAEAAARASAFDWDVVAGRFLRLLGDDRDGLPEPL